MQQTDDVVPWRPLRLCPSRRQLLSHRCASYLPVHRCLEITKNITSPKILDRAKTRQIQCLLLGKKKERQRDW